jgi:hypothetical protein
MTEEATEEEEEEEEGNSVWGGGTLYGKEHKWQALSVPMQCLPLPSVPTAWTERENHWPFENMAAFRNSVSISQRVSITKRNKVKPANVGRLCGLF